MAYTIEFAEPVYHHLRGLKSHQRTIVIEAIEQQYEFWQLARKRGIDCLSLVRRSDYESARHSASDIADVEDEEMALSLSPEFMAIINRSRQAFKAGRKFTLEEMKQAVRNVA